MNLLSPNLPHQQTTQQLYKQFLTYIKGTQKNNLHTTIQQQYKNIFSQLHKSNQIKKNKISSVECRQLNMRSTGCKFMRIQGGIREFMTIKDQVVRNQSMLIQSPNEQIIYDKILIQQQQNKQLKNQIENLKLEIRLQSKKITQTKTKIKLLDLQQNKFMQIYHLANNIVQFTDQFQIVNVRNYNGMVQEHDRIVSKLKGVKGKVRGQLMQAQYLYQNQQKQHDVKFKKLIRSCLPLQDQQNTVKKCPKINNKIYKKFIQSIQQVLIILQQKQSNYQTIKQQQCTKIQNRKFDLQLLPPDRIEWIKNIEEFQNKFNIRLESCDKILIKLYKKLKYQNQEIQKNIFQYKFLLEDYQQQYKILLEKLSQSEQYMLQCSTQTQTQKQLTKKLQKIRNHSVIFIQIMQVINGLLMKFRYIFKLFIMMNIDKRKLSQNLLKLDQVLDKNSGFVGGCRLRVNQQLTATGATGISICGQNAIVQDINSVEMREILSESLPEQDKVLLEQILTIFFNDMRSAIICKKSMIAQQIQQCKDKKNLTYIINILQTIRDECQYSYHQKLKSSFNLLFDCLKSSITVKSNHFLSYSNKGGDIKRDHFMNSDLYLPSGMFPKVKVVEDQVEDQELCDVVEMTCKYLLQFLKNTAEKEKTQYWGKNQKKNPSKVIRRLLEIRNQTSKKFKLLNLHECQKKYIKINSKQIMPSQAKLHVAKTISSSSKSQENQIVSNKFLNESQKYKGRTVQNSPNTSKTNKYAHINNFIT